MHEVLVNRLGGLSLPRKSVVSGRKTTMQQQQEQILAGCVTILEVITLPLNFLKIRPPEIITITALKTVLQIRRGERDN